MRELVKLSDKNSVLNALNEFLPLFPHLCEKVEINEYAKKLSSYANFYLAKENGENIGVLAFYANDTQNRMAYISLIGVKNSLQGKGYGKWLLENCVKMAKENKMEKIALEVDDDNQNAIMFYERNGFDFANKTQNNSQIMQKDI